MSLTSFVVRQDNLPFPGTLPAGGAPPIWRIEFEPLAYRQELFTLARIPFSETVARAVPKRQSEFLAGRLAARLATSGLDVMVGPDRAPCWPTGIEGSITHQGRWALCCVRLQQPASPGGIGIDLEEWLSDDEAEMFWPKIVSERERQLLLSVGDTFARRLTLVFSLKESLFKALYPRVGSYFDFLDVALNRIDDRGKRADFVLLRKLSRDLEPGVRVGGCWYELEGRLLTGVLC